LSLSSRPFFILGIKNLDIARYSNVKTNINQKACEANNLKNISEKKQKEYN
jgi:hypothetical protein